MRLTAEGTKDAKKKARLDFTCRRGLLQEKTKWFLGVLGVLAVQSGVLALRLL
jgi:hypothetical protein